MDERVIERLQHLPLQMDQENIYGNRGIKWSNPADSVNYIEGNELTELEGTHLNSIGNHLSNCDDSVDDLDLTPCSTPPIGTRRKRKGKMERQKEKIKLLQSGYDLLQVENDVLKQEIENLKRAAEMREAGQLREKDEVCYQNDEGATTVISTLQTENVKLIKEVARELYIKEQLTEDLDTARLESAQAKEDCAYYMTRVEELQTQNIKIKEDFKKREKVIQEFDDKCANMKEQIEALRCSNDQMEVGLRNEIDEKKKLGEELNNTNARWMIKEEESFRLNLENKQFKQQIETLKEAAKEQVKTDPDQSLKLKDLEKRITKIKKENENLKEKVSHAKQCEEELTNKLDKRDETLIKLRKEKDEFEVSLEFVKRNLDDVYKEWGEREQEIKSLEQEPIALQQELQTTLAEKEKAVAEKETAIKRNECTQFENVQLQESLKQALECKNGLSRQISKYQIEVKKLKQRTQRDIEGSHSRSRRRKRRRNCFGL